MFDDLWEYLDKENSSFLEYDEFIRGFLGEMPEKRKFFVRKVIRDFLTNALSLCIIIANMDNINIS